jgi:lactate permease
VTFHLGFAPYYALVVLALILGLPSPISKTLSGAAILSLPFPSTSTALGWTNKAVSSYSPIPLVTHPGSVVLYATVIACLLFHRRGLLHAGSAKRILSATMRGSISGIAGVFLVCAIALVLNESGMSYELAKSTSDFAGVYYPMFAALIGAFGCFTTGSNTASNALFGLFQKEVAQLIGADQSIVVSAQTTGGSVGSMISPSKLAVGSATLGIPGREGLILRRTIIPLLVTLAIIGILVQIMAFQFR